MGLKPLDPGDPEAIGPYRLLARLGAGGMGRVYLARSPGGPSVAVKVIRPEFAEDPEFRRRFRREVDTARSVGGDRTAAVIDADAGAAMPWLATAYVSGPSLATVVDRFGPLPEHTVRAIGVGLAEALTAIHAGSLIHRDLKPSNVLLAAAGPRVIDFGIARAVEGSDLTASGIVIGTPAFMSPEQAAARPLGPASDVYSLGSVLVFAATGTGPHGHAGNGAGMLYKVVHEPADVAGVPEPLARIVSAMLAKDPAERPDPREIADRLVHDGAPPVPDGTSPTVRTAWLPTGVAAELARHAAAVADLGEPLREPGTSAAEDRAEPARQPTERKPGPGPRSVTGPESAAAPAPTRAEPHRPKGRLSRRLFLAGGAAAATGGATWWAVERHLAATKTVPRPAPTPAWLWHYPGTYTPSALVSVPAAKTLVLAMSTGMVALDTESGSARWTVPGYNASYAVVQGSMIYVGNGLNADGFTLESGENTWELEHLPGNPVAADGDVLCFTTNSGATYFPTGLSGWSISRKKAVWNRRYDAGVLTTAGGLILLSDDKLLTAVNSLDGTDKWTHSAIAPRSRDAVATDADSLYCALEDRRTLSAVALDSGESRWSAKTPDGCDLRALAIAPGTVYALLDASAFDGKEHVAAYDTRDGSLRWVYASPKSLMDRPPVIAGGTLAMLATDRDDSSVIAVDLDSHRTTWIFDPPPNRIKYPTADLTTDGHRFYLQMGTDIYAIPTA